MSIIADSYRWKARIQPALILMVPAALAAGLAVGIFAGPGSVAFFDSAASKLVFRAASVILTTLVVDIGLIAVLEQMVREQGKRKEAQLWSTWGGSPTTRILRYSEIEFSSETQRRRLRKMLQALVPDIDMPTKAKETKDAKAADAAYEEYVRYLRNATRDDKKFPLIHLEKINYGFARNLLAIRSTGIGVAVVSLLASIWLTCVARVGNNSLWIAGVIVLGAQLALGTWWVLAVNPASVLVSARAYAERLFDSCDTLITTTSPDT